MNGISTHILDTATGTPASDVTVRLFLDEVEIGGGVTNQDGRIGALLPEGRHLQTGDYRLQFEIGSYFSHGFYPEVNVSFAVRDENRHYHVPLLISPFGYTTYRGS